MTFIACFQTRGNAVESPVIVVDDDQNSASQGIIASTSAVNSVTGVSLVQSIVLGLDQ